MEMGLVRKQQILDQWVTISTQVDCSSEVALKQFSSKFGQITASELEIGGSLIRLRMPLNLIENNFFNGLIDHECFEPLNLDDNWIMNVGPFELIFDEKNLLDINDYCLPKN